MILCCFCAGVPASAQLDTLQTYPFIYCYNCEEIGAYHGSVQCTVEEVQNTEVCYWRSLYDNNTTSDPEVFAVHQHSDDVLHAVGIAFGMFLNGNQPYFPPSEFYQFSVYGPDMKEPLAEVETDPFSLFYMIYPDSTYHFFTMPGKINPSYSYDDTTVMALKFAFFEEPIDVSGDFYIAHTRVRAEDHTRINGGFVPVLHETHYRPYHLPVSEIRELHNGLWYDGEMMEGTLIELFLIVEPECRKVEEVRIRTDSVGCVNVEWDSLPWQDQWVLSLTGPTGTRYDTVDSCAFRYCGLDPNEYYLVSVQTRCYHPGGHNWSEWSYLWSLDGNGIHSAAAIQGRLTLWPNPTRGQVMVSADGCRGPATVTLIDTKGKEVLRKEDAVMPLTLDTEELPQGLYLLRVTTQGFLATEKLVVGK